MKTHGRQNSMFFVVLTAAAVLVSSAFAGVNVWPSGGPNASSIDSLSIASSDPAAGRAPFQESARPTRRLPAYHAIAGVPSPSIEPEVVNVAALPDSKARQVPGPGLEGGPEPKIPHYLPLPADANIKREFRPLRLEQASPSCVLASSPPLEASFAALSNDASNPSRPPDTNGAVGPSHVVTMLNTQLRVQDRGGKEIKTVRLRDFWRALTAIAISDPRILYDAIERRWVSTAMLSSTVILSGIRRYETLLLAVSQSEDPTGNWDIYRVPVTLDRFESIDFPNLGYSRDRIVVQVNVVDALFSDVDSSEVLVFDKAALLAGKQASPTIIQSPDIGATQVPSVAEDEEAPTVYLLQQWNGLADGGGVLRLYAVSGDLGSESLTPIAFPAATERWRESPSSGDTNFGPQLGTSLGIDTLDSRISNVVYRNGSLWATQTVFLPWDGTTRSAVQWWQIAPDGTVIGRGRLDDPNGGTFYALPSIAVNQDNHLLIGCARFAADQYAGAVYAYRSAADPQEALREPALLKQGEAPYEAAAKDGRNRWGDYSSTVVDPINGRDFWTIQEYSALRSPGSDWTTWWGEVPAEPPAVLAASFRYLPGGPVAGLPLRFSDSSEGGVITWSWDFGDGTTSTVRNPIKSYAAPGIYSVVLIVSNRTGTSSSSVGVTVVAEANRPAPVLPSGGRRKRRF
ncbi:MAG TPA: PKD domain-containing protein [Thermoanaerobaculia bacterium]|nr:PKD domain-containing protein [Thermoanaerobaculia bacterium]